MGVGGEGDSTGAEETTETREDLRAERHCGV